MLDVLRDVAGEDRHEERRQQAADERATRPRGGDEGGTEADLDDPGPQDREVLVQREPVGDLGLELLAGEGQVGGAGEDHRRAEGQARHGAYERHGPSMLDREVPGHPRPVRGRGSARWSGGAQRRLRFFLTLTVISGVTAPVTDSVPGTVSR